MRHGPTRAVFGDGLRIPAAGTEMDGVGRIGVHMEQMMAGMGVGSAGSPNGRWHPVIWNL